MTPHTALIDRLRVFPGPTPEAAADAIEALEQQVAALTSAVKDAEVVCDSYAAENQRLSDEKDALTKERGELEISNAFAHGEWRAAKDQLVAAQAREAKLRGVLDEAEKQLDLSQALLERSCHHHTILAAYKNVRTIREIQADDSALQARLKQERERCAERLEAVDGEWITKVAASALIRSMT